MDANSARSGWELQIENLSVMKFSICMGLSLLAFAFHLYIYGIALFLLAIFINNARSNTNVYDMKLMLSQLSYFRYIADRFPLKGKVAIVTGSNCGIGMQVAEDLYGMGCTVIMAVRTISKGIEAADAIKAVHKNSAGSIECIALDTSDFEKVREFAKVFSSKYSKLHYLINNAGIHYASSPGSPLFHTTVDVVSKQNFDLSFASNYMGHWLLSKLLLSKMTETGKLEGIPTRHVNISSAYHLSVNGEMLTVGHSQDKRSNDPEASSTNNHNIRFRRRAYGNSKLAQVLHTQELNRRLKAEGNYNVECVSVCPGWVSGTGIAPKDFMGKFIHMMGFELKSGTAAPIGACLHPHLTGGEHVTNYLPFWTKIPLYKLSQNVRDWVADLLGVVLMFTQAHSYGCHIVQSSYESYNVELARDLYDWTNDAVERRS